MPPLVSAIVVNRNGREWLDECLEALFAQTWPDLEVILVENGSTDGSGDAAVARWGGRLRCVRNARNEGFARGNNQGIAEARGEWLFLINNDATADPRCVEELMAAAAGRPDAGMFACRIVRHEQPDVLDSAGLLLYPDGMCRSRGWEEPDGPPYDRSEEVLCPHGAAGLWRKAMLDEVGGFDETYFAYLEDLDLGFRAQLGGWRCWYVPGARVRHRKSATAGNWSKFKAFHAERNRIFNAVKLLPRFILIISPAFTLNRYLLMSYAAATKRGLSSDFVREYSYGELLWVLIRAHLAALWRLPEMLRKRRAIARKRKLSTAEWYRLISRFKLDAIELALKH